jgi:hypothetical protein
MKFAAIVGIKDEVSLLPLVIDQLLRIGVDLVIARDNNSTDGSREYLAARQGPRLSLEPLTRDEESSDELWAEREGALARGSGADWVLFLDADEFWLPASGSLHECPEFADPLVDVVTVPRFNAVMRKDSKVLPPAFTPDAYSMMDLVVAAPAKDFRVHLEQNPTTAWITGVPKAKIAVRAHRAGPVNLGHHNIRSIDGKPIQRKVAESLVIAHFPFTTYERFERKVSNIRALLESTPDILPGHAGWHWKRWVRVAEQPGALEEEFRRQSFDAHEVEDMRRRGVIRDAASLLSSSKGA